MRADVLASHPPHLGRVALEKDAIQRPAKAVRDPVGEADLGPENAVKPKSTVLPENSALRKLTEPRENMALRKLTLPPGKLASVKLTVPPENTAPLKSPPSKQRP